MSFTHTSVKCRLYVIDAQLFPHLSSNLLCEKIPLVYLSNDFYIHIVSFGTKYFQILWRIQTRKHQKKQWQWRAWSIIRMSQVNQHYNSFFVLLISSPLPGILFLLWSLWNQIHITEISCLILYEKIKYCKKKNTDEISNDGIHFMF